VQITHNSESEWDIYRTDPEYHYNIVLAEMKVAAATSEFTSNLLLRQ